VARLAPHFSRGCAHSLEGCREVRRRDDRKKGNEIKEEKVERRGR